MWGWVSACAICLKSIPRRCEWQELEKELMFFLWKDLDGRRLSFKRYAEEMSWGEGEGVYADRHRHSENERIFSSVSTKPRKEMTFLTGCEGC